jgi:tetratricopeptide (TPR) repeat protein
LEKVCPECATPLARSLHGNLLRYADIAWLRKIRLGVRVMLWNLLIYVLLIAAIVLSKMWGWPGILRDALVLAAAAMNLWATLLVTAQEPRISVVEDTTTLRRAIRACAITMFVGAVCSKAGTVFDIGFALEVCGAVLAIVGIVAYFGEFIYLRRFAKRIPDNKLAQSTTAVMWGFVVAYAAIVLSGLIAVILVLTAAGGPIVDVLTVLGIAGNVGVLVFGVAYIILLFWFNAAMTRACDQAHRLAKHLGPVLTATRLGTVSLAAASGSGLLRPSMSTNPLPPSPAAAHPRTRTDDLVAGLTTALWREPNSPQAHYDLAVALAGRGRLREATQQYREAIHIHPDYVEAHLNLANCLLRQHQSNEAVLHLHRALQVSPDFPTAHYNLANILFRQGRADEAIRHYSAAVQVKPDFAPARHNLAVALLKRGRGDEAVEHLRAALQLDPTNSRIHKELEAAQARQSHPDAVH